MKEFRLQFLCADEKEYDGPCVSVNFPLEDGYMGILADHANMIAIMETGVLFINTGEKSIEYAVTEGLVEVKDGEVLIMAFSAEKPDEIDENRAKEAAMRARMRLKRKMSNLEFRQNQAALSRAMARLKVIKGRH